MARILVADTTGIAPYSVVREIVDWQTDDRKKLRLRRRVRDLGNSGLHPLPTRRTQRLPQPAGTHLYNVVRLVAMQRISMFEDHRVRQKVNYSALDVEELGSVYESLLDFQPAFNEQPEGISFELRTGSERKSTGSYYTRPELVCELIESALVPVMEDRLAIKEA